MVAQPGMNALPSLVQYSEPVQTGAPPDGRQSNVARPGALDPIGQDRAFESVLHHILPPCEWHAEGKDWKQTVSGKAATRLDVVDLQEALDANLQHRQARNIGLCPVREHLYSECMNELIRQVTIDCPERGLLLLRVRDEMKMTTAAYEMLCESAVAFGLRKALEAEHGKPDLLEELEKSQAEKAALERMTAELKMQCEVEESRDAEAYSEDEKKRAEELSYLGRYLDQLKSQADTYLTARRTPSSTESPKP